MKRIELQIIALTDSESHEGNYALILEEATKRRRLVIIIGSFEAQAIAISLESLPTNRPLTHDLFKNFLDAAGITLQEVVISHLDAGVFRSLLVGKLPDGSLLEVDARTSDAIALAVRYGCPIYTTEAVMDAAGILVAPPGKTLLQNPEELSGYSLEELERLLQEVLAREDFESAVKIRNAMKGKR